MKDMSGVKIKNTGVVASCNYIHVALKANISMKLHVSSSFHFMLTIRNLVVRKF